jgi:hypothetical protein
VRRDADGSKRTAATWESLTERLIREAQEDGHFDDLPGHGRPLVLDDDRYAGDMATANRLLRNAGATPAWIETDRAARDAEARIERLITQAAVASPAAGAHLARKLTALLDEHADAIDRLATQAPGPRQQRLPLSRAKLRRRLEEALENDRRRGRHGQPGPPDG